MRFSVPLFWALSVTALAQGQQQASNPPTDISALTVDRKGCFGACPRYTLTLRREGKSTYIGRTGPRRGLYVAPPVQAGDFDQLTQVVSKIRFFDLPDVIGPIAIDTEQVVVTVSTAEKSKAITSYDLSKAPAPFATLVMLADGLAAKLLWEDLNEPKNGILGPFPLSRVEPQYTEEARKARLQGSAIVQVQVRPDGTVAFRRHYDHPGSWNGA